MSYSYAKVEAVLFKILGTEDEGQSALRSRLKRFRVLGIPSGPRTGTGSRVEYTNKHVIEMALACRLSEHGVSPKFIPESVSNCMNWLASLKTKSDILVSVSVGDEGRMMIAFKDNNFLTKLSEEADVFSIINISRIKSRVDRELAA